MEIIERVFQTMEEKNKKSIDLAKYLNVNQSVISTWKKRCKNPPAEYIIRICEFLGVSANFLLSGKDPSELSTEEVEILDCWRELSYSNKVIAKGKIFELVKDQGNDCQKFNFEEKVAE